MMKLSMILILTVLSLLVLISEQTAHSGQRRQRNNQHRQSLRNRNGRLRNGRSRNNPEETSQENTPRDGPSTETPSNRRNDNVDVPRPSVTRQTRQNNGRQDQQIRQEVRQLAANRRINGIRARGVYGFHNVHIQELATTRDSNERNDSAETDLGQNELASNATENYTNTQASLNADNSTHLIGGKVDGNQSTGTDQTPDNYVNVTQNYTEPKVRETYIPKPPVDYGFWLARERKRQTRILMITTQILRKLKLPRQPNVTISQVPDGQREKMIKWMKKIGKENKHGAQYGNGQHITKRYHCHMPSCGLPRKSDDSWENKSAFRLYFDLEQPEGVRIQVSSAILRLFKKHYDEDECDCKKKKPEDNSSLKRQRAHAKKRQSGEDDNDSDESGDDTDPDSFRVTIHQYTRPVRKNKRPKTKKVPVAENLISNNYEGWVRFDIKSAVSDWIKNPNRNYGLMVKVQGIRDPYKIFEPWNCTAGSNETNQINCKFSIVFPGKGNVNLTDLFDSNLNATHPSLQVLTTEYAQRAPRHRRHIPEIGSITLRRATVAQGSGSCRFVPFAVDLRAMDRDSWIIAPRTFKTGYCIGQCGMKNTTNNTCGPSQMGGLSVLHFDETGNVVMTSLEGMVVKQCGCRNTGG